ncbi:MAG: AsmA family protein, partial [Sphingobacteriales bacterium]
MLKKIIKIFAAFILLIIIAIIAIPYFFKNQINEKIVQAINQKLNAKVSFTDADLSLLKSFPDASINIKNILILNKAPFEGDTLVSLAELNLKMSVKELFKDKNEAMQIDGIDAKNGLVNILFNKDGLGNYDIFIKQASTDTTKSKPLALKIKAYSVENLKFNYYDERSKINFVLDSLQHTGLGNFAASQLDLSTKSTSVVTLMMDKNKYINKVKLALDALLAIDLDKNKYTFKNNTALINQLPLSFDGFIQLKDAGQDYDLRFKTPNSNFQNFLGLIPSAYSGSLKDVKTTGNFKVDGFVKGLYTAKNIPQFNISIAA